MSDDMIAEEDVSGTVAQVLNHTLEDGVEAGCCLAINATDQRFKLSL